MEKDDSSNSSNLSNPSKKLGIVILARTSQETRNNLFNNLAITSKIVNSIGRKVTFKEMFSIMKCVLYKKLMLEEVKKQMFILKPLTSKRYLDNDSHDNDLGNKKRRI